MRRGPLAVTFVAAETGGEAGSGHGQVRVAFAVGRGAGPAVTRNRVRRRLRAILSKLALAPGRYLIGAGAPAGVMSFGELRRDLIEAMVAVGALGTVVAGPEHGDGVA